jgi:cysteine desulfurase
MSVERIYLDWNATAPLLPEARVAMTDALDLLGNPSSVHKEGRAARASLERARDKVAGLLKIRPADVVFTSGATEANNCVLAAGWDVVALSALEHDSIREPARRHARSLVDLPLLSSGIIDLSTLSDRLSRHDNGNRLFCLQLANNETGVIQPTAAAAAIARALGWSVLCDAVQGAGRIDLGSLADDADYVVVSAHKLGGPKGAGALVARATARAPAASLGGGQERRRRSGTENVPAIAGFGAAAESACARLGAMESVRAMRERLESGLRAATPAVQIVGEAAQRLPNTSCFALAGLPAELAIVKLDLAGFAVSAGAACSSGKVAQSTVLTGMGLPSEVARSAIRVSIGPTTTMAEIDTFIGAWRSISATDAIAA